MTSSAIPPPPMSDIGRFYKQLDDLKTKLVAIMGQFGKNQEIIDLNKYYDKVHMARTANVRLVIEIMYEYVTKDPIYVDNILMRDDDFFLEKVEDIEKGSLSHEEQAKLGLNGVQIESQELLFMSQMRHMWKDIKPTVRDNLWKYIQVICLLAERILGKNIFATRTLILKSEGKIK